jgi:hypothetical protein
MSKPVTACHSLSQPFGFNMFCHKVIEAMAATDSQVL